MVEHFIIAGAQRSGTSWLYRQFERHPQVCMSLPLRPEPKFFLREDAVNLGYSEYRARYFAHWRDEILLGEKSTSYIERTDSIERIRLVLPGAFLVFVLRDPVQRAYSNWRFSREQGIESLSFEDALTAEPARVAAWNGNGSGISVCPFAYAGRGYYARHLETWARHFPREQMTVVTSESLFADKKAMGDLFAKFRLDREGCGAKKEPVNVSEDENGDSCPDATVAKTLRARYQDDMRSLKRFWQLDISAWSPCS